MRATYTLYGLQLTPVSLGVSGGLLLGFLLLTIFPDLEGVVFLVPGYTMTRPFQVITAGFFEDSALNLLAGAAAMVFCGALLQPSWGDRELARFVLLTNALQGCASWVGMIVLYILFRSEHFLFARLGGCTGVLGALAVALRQHALQRGAFSLPLAAPPPGAPPLPAAPRGLEAAARYAPSLCVAWSTLVLLASHSGLHELLFSLNGILAGWAYLRFYQPREHGASGDASAAFAFHNLLPPPLQPPFRVLGEAAWLILSSSGCFPPAGWAAHADHAAPAAVLPPQLPADILDSPALVTTSDPEVAERRRQRARELIDARLAAKVAAAGSGAATPPGPPREV